MFKVEFKFNGKELQRAALKAAAEAIVKRARNVCCPLPGGPGRAAWSLGPRE
jgi:hexokinase